MKQKRFDKRLVLNKKTVSNLTENQMEQVKGGVYKTDPDFCRTDLTCTIFTNQACPPEIQTVYVGTCCSGCGQACI